ncbi:hypothetical protein NPIL_506381 [Nephila pilipes]|uniref:Uncharacterized protein n=1 Tax=Nephila pilipes TaxID=299642 RepID=A0A8X6NHC5_NEPPI|nr:hypothetical protein NPIL_506381 [Nephila pilipes]
MSQRNFRDVQPHLPAGIAPALGHAKPLADKHGMMVSIKNLHYGRVLSNGETKGKGLILMNCNTGPGGSNISCGYRGRILSSTAWSFTVSYSWENTGHRWMQIK